MESRCNSSSSSPVLYLCFKLVNEVNFSTLLVPLSSFWNRAVICSLFKIFSTCRYELWRWPLYSCVPKNLSRIFKLTWDYSSVCSWRLFHSSQKIRLLWNYRGYNLLYSLPKVTKILNYCLEVGPSKWLLFRCYMSSGIADNYSWQSAPK